MNQQFIDDYERFTPDKYKIVPFIIRYIRNHELRYVYWGRKLQYAKARFGKIVACAVIHQYRRKYGLEMNFKNVCGGGIRLIHPWMITVNANAVIGRHVTLFKGVTIGVIEHGEKAGNPMIGDHVTICANATICGRITIGNNSWIAAGSFVNFDVLANSLAIGNPGVIHRKKE